jgi:hypothetical protein
MTNGDDNGIPKIEPVADEICRPLWSVMIPTFNCARFLGRTLETVLEQDPGPESMQIEVVDHCSDADDPESVVTEVGRGRVDFYRRPKNEGPVANFNACIRRSRGRLVHILHGDDYVLPGFYREIERMFAMHKEAALLATRCFQVDKDGTILNVSPRICELETGGNCGRSLYYETPLQFPAVVIARRFYETNGGFLVEPAHVTDREMWLRAITSVGGVVSSQVLACYRVFNQNDTSRLKRTGENVLEMLQLGEILQTRHPDFSMRQARRFAASVALSQAEGFEAIGAAECAEANLDLWRRLTPWPERVFRAAARLSSKFRGREEWVS